MGFFSSPEPDRNMPWIEGEGTPFGYEKVGDACHLVAGYKSRILASFRVFMMKHHYF